MFDSDAFDIAAFDILSFDFGLDAYSPSAARFSFFSPIGRRRRGVGWRSMDLTIGITR